MYLQLPEMSRATQILVETTKKQREALASVLRESGETLTEWFTDNIAEATAEFASARIDTPRDLQNLDELEDSGRVIAQLQELDWAFADDDTTYLSHDIHPYPAKFIPQIPRNLIARLSLPGECVWDPFGGSGTTALESVLLGRQGVSSDVNPLAEVIGKGKLLTLTKEDDDFLAALAEEFFIVSANEASVAEALNRLRPLAQYMPDIPNATQWFHAQAWNELAYLKGRINGLRSEKCRRLASVCLSKIVLKASFQDSETRYARCQKEFPPGKVIRLFAGSLESSPKKVRYLGTFLRFREAKLLTADLRKERVVPAVLGGPDCYFAALSKRKRPSSVPPVPALLARLRPAGIGSESNGVALATPERADWDQRVFGGDGGVFAEYALRASARQICGDGYW